MKKIYFMRHGLTEMNVAGIWSGTTETPLTAEGRKQAKLAGKQAKSLGIDTVVCSTMGRAKETAEIVAKEMNYPLDQIHHSSLLIERHFGVLEGQPYKPDLDLDGFADIETTDTLLHRAKLALEWIDSLPGDTVLVVSHSAMGRAIRHLLNPSTPFRSPSFKNAEIVEINNMKRPDSTLYQLQELVANFAPVERNHYALNTNRRENDIEHSFSVAMLSWYISSKHNLGLDTGKILKYALAHDFVEVYAGDTNTFASEKERANKLEKERLALQKLSSEFTSFTDLVDTLKEYESKETPEALFVWTVDKMQALILGELDNWRPYSELDISYESFCSKYAELLGEAASEIKQIFESVVEYSKTTYYDQPKE